MASTLNRIRHVVLILLLSFGLILVSCNGVPSTPGGQPSPTETASTPGEILEPSPTTTSTPQPGRILLVIQTGIEAEYAGDVSSRLSELASQSSLRFEQSDALAGNEPGSTRAVFWIGDAAEFSRQAAASAQIPFILIGPEEAEPGANVSQILVSPLHASFVAGLITILIAPDRRAGGLFSADDPLSPQLMDAFTNGARYLCGNCAPIYAPVVFFPLTSTAAAGQGIDAWKAAFDQLDQNRIETLYLPAQGASREMLDYLKSQGVVVVGSAPPPEGYSSLWAATVTQDPAAAVDQIWEMLFQFGSSAQSVDAPVMVTDFNESILTPGKLQLVEKVAAELKAGMIAPLSVP